MFVDGVEEPPKHIEKIFSDIENTIWGDGPTDGLGAMVGAWHCNEEADRAGISMREMNYMKEIESYNKVDCQVMWELISYLRQNHS